MAEIRGHLLPVYVLVDESASMSPYMSELNDGLRSLHEALLAEPMTAAKVRLSVLGFSDDVVLRVHLADIRSTTQPPQMVYRNRTMYGEAFSSLQRQIPTDIASLKSQQYAVHRPVAVFLSDGEPTDKATWTKSRAQLNPAAMTAAPNIIACGIGDDADAGTMLEVASRPEFAYVSIRGTDVGSAIAKFCVYLTKSIVASGRAVGTGNDELFFDKPAGFSMAIDVL